MALPKIIYDAGSGDVTLTCRRGPRDFRCWTETAANDNIAPSGLRERVVEAHHIMISFTMPALLIDGGAIDDDLAAWSTFGRWANGGGNFKFYPDADGAGYYTCTFAQKGFEAHWQGPGRYAATFEWRIVPDAQAPANDGVVMEAFYGVTS